MRAYAIVRTPAIYKTGEIDRNGLFLLIGEQQNDSFKQ